ncbi:MAG: YidC/Oxa1 family membrane protein insertase [Tissierellia bacterium]|nr:YidC/Oxa1 family membrane protein insertase [Tissierellia bacterium]
MINFLANILGSVLRGVYGFVSQIGQEPQMLSYYAMAIILTTFIFKFILLPFNVVQVRNQKKMAKIQPEIKKLQKKYGYDQQTLTLKTQELYKEEGYNPMAGCLPLLIQFPIALSFYRIFRFPEQFAFSNPGFFEAMQKNFFHIGDLGNPDTTIILPIVAAVTTYLTSELTQGMQANQGPSSDQAAQTMNMMKIMMPVMIFFFARNMPAGLVIYWITSSVFSIVQQLINKLIVKKELEEEI